jgi:hypothetical protein
MDLNAPTTLGLAWILAPLLITLAAAGLGIGLGRLAGIRLGVLTLPAGFMTGVALMTFFVELGLGGVLTVAICAAAAIGGAAAGWGRPRLAKPVIRRPAAPGLVAPVAAALGAYAVGMAPLVGSGRSGVVGYILNNDPSVHLSIVELLRDRGAEATDHNASSYEFVSTVFQAGYPLGSHVWVLFGSTLGGVDAFHIWSPVIALMVAFLALVIYDLVRGLDASPAFAGIASVAVACGYLPFSYLAQGGAKEIAITLAVYGALALLALGVRTGATARSLLPAAVAFAAGLGVFGLGAAAWLGPLALVVGGWLAWNARRRQTGLRLRPLLLTAVAGAVVAVPPVLSSIDFIRGSDDDLVNPAQIGNLVGPVPWREAFNVWLAYDYRFAVPDFENLTNAAIVLAAALAIAGVVDAVVRRRPVVPLAVLVGAAGAIVISSRYAIYLDAKSYVVLAPALGLATAAGVLVAARRAGLIRTLALGSGALLAAGVFASDALVYAGAWMTPKDRFQDLIDLADRYRDDGPMLVSDREDYGKYFFRDSKPWESWGAWQPDRGLRAGRVPPAAPWAPDFDDYTLEHMARFRLLLERKSPAGSAPPSNFKPVEETRDYRIWRREGDMPRAHISLGVGRADGTDRLDCADPEVESLIRSAERGDGRVMVSYGGRRPIVSAADTWQQFGGSFIPGPEPGFANRRGGVALPFMKLRPGTYEVFVQGGFGPGIRVQLGVRGIGDAFGDLGLHSGWHHLGGVEVESAGPALAVVGLEKPWWQSGSHRSDITGPLVFVPTPTNRRVAELPGSEARSLCGRTFDWIELI